VSEPWWRGLAAAASRRFGRGRDTATEPPSTELARAIAAGDMRLHYQPKLHLRSRRIVSLEALVRWQHPRRGLVMPGEFIPMAEQSADIATLTSWVLRTAVADQRALAREGHDLPVFINIAAVLLADDAFIREACALVKEDTSIGFEITETSVIRDPQAAIANLARVANLGIPIAIDDYGAGLSSLAYLKQLPACELKIDKLFITQLTSSHRDPLIVRSTIDLAHALEMEVVAEGVESETALALLSVMGCDMAQGYHICRPANFASIRGFLDQHRNGWKAEADGAVLNRLTSVLKRA
jgi:EAL domain-containing protein (putative c-di-GMP-specific phosphodiesterase class I)